MPKHVFLKIKSVVLYLKIIFKRIFKCLIRWINDECSVLYDTYHGVADSPDLF